MKLRCLTVVILFFASGSITAQPEFKVLENRRIVDSSVGTWPYTEDESEERSYFNFGVFLGGVSSDLFPSSTYRNSSYVYVGVNLNSPVFNNAGNEIHLPLYVLNVKDKGNLIIKEIPEGINLLQKLYFRADQASRSFLKMVFRGVSARAETDFLKSVERLESYLAQMQNVALTDVSFGASDREANKIEDLSDLLLESIDIIQRTKLEKERTSIAYVIQPLEFKKDFTPKSTKNENLTVDRTFDPVLRTNAGEVRFPYLILDVHLKTYFEVEGLPSDHKTDFRCSNLAEKTTLFSESIEKYSNLMTPQQRIFEANLMNVSNEYVYLIETYGMLEGQDPSEGGFGFDDDGFLVGDDEEQVEAPSTGDDEIVSAYCGFIRHINEFGAEIESNPSPDFRRYFQDNLHDIRGCLDLNFLKNISDPQLLNQLKECK